MDEYAPFKDRIQEFAETNSSEDPAHDIHHVLRVVWNAEKLGRLERGNLNIVIPSAWLHDCVVLPKNHPDRKNSSVLASNKAVNFLESIHYPEKYIGEISHCIEAHSFSADVEICTHEAAIVQDADRLDALGAVGIARCFSVGGQLNRALYNYYDPFCKHRTPDDTKYTLDHFYSKLLKLKNKMNTRAGKEEAKKLTSYMEVFLSQWKDEISSL